MYDPTDGPQHTYASPVNLAKWVTGAFALYACAHLYALYFYVSEIDFVRAIADDSAADGDFLGFAHKLETLAAAILACRVAVVITWCMWIHRVAKNTLAWDEPMMVTPGWAVGYYFIPILNIWKPYTALREVWQASDPHVDPTADRWTQVREKAPGFVLAWWLVYLATGVTSQLSVGRLDDLDPSAWVSGMETGPYAVAVELIGVALALLVCWRLTRRQEDRAHGVVPRAELVHR